MFTQSTVWVIVVGSDVISWDSCWKKRLPKTAPMARTQTRHEAPDDAGRRPAPDPAAVSQRMAGSMAIANSHDSMRMKRKWPIAPNTVRAMSHSVTSRRMLITDRRSWRASNAIIVSGRGSCPGGVCAPMRR